MCIHRVHDADEPCVLHLQDFAEESQEFQAGVDDNRFRRRLRNTVAAPARACGPSAEFPASSIVETYLICLQAGLQARPGVRHQCALCSLCPLQHGPTAPRPQLRCSHRETGYSVSVQESVQTLVNDMGVHPNATDVARRIWTAHLTCCGVLEPDFVM